MRPTAASVLSIGALSVDRGCRIVAGRGVSECRARYPENQRRSGHAISFAQRISTMPSDHSSGARLRAAGAVPGQSVVPRWSLVRNGRPMDRAGDRRRARPRKAVFWSSRFLGGVAEPTPHISVTCRRLDRAVRPIIQGSPGTNAHTREDGWFMIGGIDPDSEGCWQVTAEYRGATLSYIYERRWDDRRVRPNHRRCPASDRRSAGSCRA